MAIPYRDWNIFDVFTGWAVSADNTIENEHWVAARLEYLRSGWSKSVGGDYYNFRCLARPKPWSEFSQVEDIDSLNCLYEVVVDINAVTSLNTWVQTHCHVGAFFQKNPAPPLFWDSRLANGRYYDGVTMWSPGATPLVNGTMYCNQPQFDMFAYPVPFKLCAGATYDATLAGPECWNERQHFYRNGLLLAALNPGTGGNPGVGQGMFLDFQVLRVRAKFLNPIVNEKLQSGPMTTAGGISVVFNGLGFDNDDTEIRNFAQNSNNDMPVGGWQDAVTHITFHGLQGQGDYVLHSIYVHPAPDFVVNDNTQITIAAMPAMLEGSYEIFLDKRHAQIFTIFGVFPAGGYAGDWNCEADGRLYRGSRLSFYVLPVGGDGGGGGGADGDGGKKGAVISLHKWHFKNFLGDVIDRYYSPGDIISPKIFYDGRIQDMSGFTRSVAERTGLYVGADMSVTLANPDKEFSKLLGSYRLLKNQIVEVYTAWRNYPEAMKESAAVFVVNDFELAGPAFHVSLGDLTKKYFQRKIPLYRCTKEEYPNIHDNAKGLAMPEVLGTASYTGADNCGAVEARYIDTVLFQYLGAHGSLKAITEVYGDGVLADPATYAVSYADGGRTYITFTSDQGDKKITFNCKGYVYDPWNDPANGYIQNPAYVIGYFLQFLAGLPANFLDISSIETLADIFIALGEQQNGYLIIQNEQDMEIILGELLMTLGAYSAFDRIGRFKIVRKDISNIPTAETIFAQIDTLSHPVRKFNYADTVNRIRAQWNYYPAAEIYAQEDEFGDEMSIEDLEKEMEAPEPYCFPWTLSAAWGAFRANEELLKYRYGYLKFSFSLPLDWIDRADLLTDLRLQDPFGIDILGLGEYGRYCFVTSLGVDYQGNKLDIEAADLGWLLCQYFVVGDEATLATNWATADLEDRMYAYACDETTGRFADGEPGKKVSDESLGG
jgi:hypothetical protein